MARQFFKNSDGSIVDATTLKCYKCEYKTKFGNKEKNYQCLFNHTGVAVNDSCEHFITSAYWKTKEYQDETNIGLNELAEQGIYPKYPIKTIVWLVEDTIGIYEATITNITICKKYDIEQTKYVFDYFSYNVKCKNYGERSVNREEKTLFENKERAFQEIMERKIKRIQGHLNDLCAIAKKNNIQLNINSSVIPLLNNSKED